MTLAGSRRKQHARRLCLLLLALVASGACPARGQERCGVGRDFLVRALERVTPGANGAELEDALQLVKRACALCAELGDAWYYRSLFEKKLGRAAQAKFALDKARLLGSEAMSEGADPFTLSTVPGESISPFVRDKWALVVGIGRFRDRTLTPLQFTTKDAQEFAGWLKDSSSGKFRDANVKVLADAEATTARIKAGLNWLARSAARDDLVVIYLSSHGSPRESDTVAGLTYVITHDTEMGSEDNLYGSALPMEYLAEIVRTRIQARRAAIFLDTCHSGGAVTRAGATSQTLDRLREGVGRVIVASSQVKEESYESRELGNGFFTYALLRALRQQNGTRPISDVFNELRAEVSSLTHGLQNPVMSRSDQGANLVLGVEPGKQDRRGEGAPPPARDHAVSVRVGRPVL